MLEIPLWQTQLWLYQHKVAPEPKKPQIFWSDPFWSALRYFESAHFEGTGTGPDLGSLRGICPLAAEELLDIIVGDLKRHHLRFYVSTCACCNQMLSPTSDLIPSGCLFDSSTFLIEVCRITHCSQAEAARQLHAMFVDRRFREPTEMAKPFTEVLPGIRILQSHESSMI
eukprot:4956902-Prymnesium_polylepis.1